MEDKISNEKVEYWRKRMLDRLFSLRTDVDVKLKEIDNNANHSKLRNPDLTTAMKKIYSAIEGIEKSIKEAKYSA